MGREIVKNRINRPGAIYSILVSRMRILYNLCLIRFVNDGDTGFLQKDAEYDDDRHHEEENFPLAEESFFFVHCKLN